MIFQVAFSVLFSLAIFLLAFRLETGEIGWGSNVSALMVVLGGTLSATLIAYPWKRLAWTAEVLKKSFLYQCQIKETISTLVSLAHIYRQGGMRALEKEGDELPQGVIKTAVELMAYHCSREKMEQALQTEVRLIFGQFESAYKVLMNMARLAPALGLAGTIVSLIRVFEHIQDPKSLVGYMAIALLSTFYGVVLANLCFIPLSNKLKEFAESEEVRYELIQEGVLDLYDEENPRAIRHKLEALSKTVVKPDSNKVRPNISLIPPKKRVSSVMT